jgi:hypothetical protein
MSNFASLFRNTAADFEQPLALASRHRAHALREGEGDKGIAHPGAKLPMPSGCDDHELFPTAEAIGHRRRLPTGR